MQGEETADTAEISKMADQINEAEEQDVDNDAACNIDTTQRITAVYSNEQEAVEAVEEEVVENGAEIQQQGEQEGDVPVEIHPDIIVDSEESYEPLGELFGKAMGSIKQMIKNRKFDNDAPELKAFFSALAHAFKTNRALQIGTTVFVIVIALLVFMPSSKYNSGNMANDIAVSETDKPEVAEFKVKIKAIDTELKRHQSDLENILAIIDNDNRKTIASQLNQMKAELEQIQEKLYRLTPPEKKYERVKERFMQRITHERNMLLALMDVCNDPLGMNASARLNDVNSAIDEINRLNDGGATITQRVEKMQEMIAKERAFDAKRQEMRKFVAEVNTLLWKYSDQEATMEDLLGKADSKRFKSGRYLGEVHAFITEREALLAEIGTIHFPDGTYGLMDNLKDAIQISINCCNTMTKIANEELTYDERKAIYKKVCDIHNDSKRALYLFKTDLKPYREYAE